MPSADGPGRLAEFLRARRRAVGPVDVGLVPGGARQVPGLRREEVAMLAGVSTDYYIHLEQGRERRPSAQVVASLARALLLDHDAHRHLADLASTTIIGGAGPEQPSPEDFAALIRRWTTTPAMVVTSWLEVVARNPAADALYGGLLHRDNLARMTFLDAGAREFVDDWAQLAHCTVGTLRSASDGREPPELTELIEELSLHSADFRQEWARYDVHRKRRAVKVFHHPIGRLELTQHVLTVPERPDLQLWVYDAEAGSEHERRLHALVFGLKSVKASLPA
jgi:transcriptional regulator with XRE-family HTH domain